MAPPASGITAPTTAAVAISVVRLEIHRESLKGSMGVEPITEEIRIAWSSATTNAWKGAIIMKDGSRISIDTSCKRSK